MRRHRADTNQRELVDILESCGVSVAITSQVGNGFTDLVLGFRGDTDIAEIKHIGDFGWKYTPAQTRFRRRWNGSPILTFEDAESVLKWVNKTRSA